MKNFLFIPLFIGLTAAAGSWKAPTAELRPEVVIHPNPVSASRWLWFQSETVKTDTDCFYRSKLLCSDQVKSVELICYFDDSGEIYLNGHRLERNRRFQQKNLPMKAQNFQIPRSALKKENILAVHVRNDKYSGGFFMLGKKYLDNGSIEFFHSSPKTWKASGNHAKGWEKSDFNDSLWVNAKDFGDVLTAPWTTATDIVNLCTSPEEKVQYEKEEELASSLPAALKNEPDSRMITVWKNGVPFWKIGEKEFPPVMFRTPVFSFRPSARKSDTLLKCALSGVPVIEYTVDTGRSEIGDGVYDFSMIDRDVSRILNLAPNAYIGLHIRISSFDNWLKKHPDEAIGYATGKADNKITKIWRTLDVGGRPIRPSYASRPFRQEIDRMVRIFGKHVKAQPWYKRVVTVRTSYGCYSEWHYYGMAGQMPDTGKAMTAAFRRYLTAKYGTDAGLQKAWHDTRVTLNTAIPPDVKERHGRNLFLRDPATTEKKVLDYYECHQNEVADTLLAMARSVKEQMPKVLTGAYYGYVFGMGTFPSEGQTLALEKVLSSPYIDFLSSPYSYGSYARHKGGNGMFRSIPEIFHHHRKVMLNELDNRTHLTVRKREYHNTETADESAQVLLRDISLSAISGIGVQFLELSKITEQGWFNAPELYSAIHEGIENWKDIRSNLKPMQNEVAVVFDYRELYRNGHPVAKLQKFNTMLGDLALSSLYFSGIQFDLFSMEGFLASANRYKTVIFLNACSLAKAERNQLKGKIRNSSVIWIYAPGLVTENGYSRETMKALTGFSLDYTLKKMPMCMKLFSGKILGSKSVLESPRVFVSADKKTEILASYEDNTTAMALQQVSDRCSVFSGIPINDPQVWAQLLKRTGVKAYTKPGLFVKIQNPYILVHTGKAGEYTIRIPQDAGNVQSIFDKTPLPVRDSLLHLKSDGCKTWLLKMQ